MNRRRLVIPAVLVAAVLLAPGWRGRFEPVPHEQVLDAARAAGPGDFFGVARPVGERGEQWHLQYGGGLLPRLLQRAGLRSALPGLVAPAYAAHVPAGAERADGYFAVRTSVHWPWWRPGGGLDWRDPRDDGG